MTGHIPPSAQVVGPKPHLAHYAGASYRLIPNGASLEALREALAGLPPQETFVLFGEPESAKREALAALAALRFPDRAPDWLEPVAWSDPAGRRALYRLVRDRDR